jgi:hypothetical protein
MSLPRRRMILRKRSPFQQNTPPPDPTPDPTPSGTEVRKQFYFTGYGSYDNDPPGYNIAYPNARHPQTGTGVTSSCYGAGFGGDGTYGYPIPLAADIRYVPAGTLLYIEHAQVYGEVVDYCQASHDRNDAGNSTIQLIDIWVGGDLTLTTTKQNTVNAASNSITRLESDAAAYAIVNPLSGKTVRSTVPISGIGNSCSVNFGPAVSGGSTPSTPTPDWEETFSIVPPTNFPRTVWYYESGDWVRGYNNELQAYVRAGSTLATTLKNTYAYEPVSIDTNGDLLLRAIRTPAAISSQVGGAPWLSGMVNSQGTKTVQYGYLEAEIQLPNVLGTLPAFWMLRANEETKDEVDIAEIPGDNTTDLTTHFFSVHDYSTGSDVETIRSKTLSGLGSGFHTFGLDWSATSMQAYLDRQPVGTAITTPSGMKNPFYMILNLAVGGDWPKNPPGNISDIQMRVRRVSHWTTRPF